MSAVSEVNDHSFDSEVLQADQPVLVDFWAPWCGPCRELGPTVDRVAKEFGDRAKFVKVNVDHNQETSVRYNVRGVPTLILFKGGVVRDRFMGNTTRDNIVRMIENEL